MQLDVIDVSSWQGDIQFDRVKAAGIGTVIIRCGFTGYRSSLPVTVDSMFEKNYAGAHAAGLKIGVYYYSCATTVQKAREEAEFVLQKIRGKQMDYPVYFDTEDNHDVTQSGVNPQNQVTIGRAALTEIASTFCSIIREGGYVAGIYASLNWLNTHLDMSKLSAYECWVAQWAAACTYTGTYQMWQYTSSGSVQGISGNVDRSYCYKDYGAADVPSADSDGLVQYPMQRNALTAGFDALAISGHPDFHFAIDISRTQNQSFDVVAAHNGTVILSAWDDYYGNLVVLKGYWNGVMEIVTRYAHLASTAVKTGDTVTRGQTLGVQGKTGGVTAQHLHFETWLVPKGYTYNVDDRERYAVDPVSLCHIVAGQSFPFVDELSHNFGALPWPLPPIEQKVLQNTVAVLSGAGVGMYAAPMPGISPIVSGRGRAQTHLAQYCGDLRYPALESATDERGGAWVCAQTCYGPLWLPLTDSLCALEHQQPDDTGDPQDPDTGETGPTEELPCEQELLRVRQAVAEMQRILKGLN